MGTSYAMRPWLDLPPAPKQAPAKDGQPRPTNQHAGPITIACVLRRSPEYDAECVRRLQRAVSRNVTRPFRFVCLTDELAVAGVETIALRHPEWVTKQSKMELFRPELELGRVFYLDLDTVVCGSLEDMLSYDGTFCMLGDLGGKPQQCRGSGVMAWAPGFGAGMYEAFCKLPPHVRDTTYRVGGGRSDQLFINHFMPVRPHVFQQFWPDQLASYKLHCRRRGRPPHNARIVCFHGRIKMRETTEKWISETWA